MTAAKEFDIAAVIFIHEYLFLRLNIPLLL